MTQEALVRAVALQRKLVNLLIHKENIAKYLDSPKENKLLQVWFYECSLRADILPIESVGDFMHVYMERLEAKLQAVQQELSEL